MEKLRAEKPKGCPGSFSIYTDKCFDCIAQDPYVICPGKTAEDIKAMFPEEYKFPPGKLE